MLKNRVWMFELMNESMKKRLWSCTWSVFVHFVKQGGGGCSSENSIELAFESQTSGSNHNNIYFFLLESVHEFGLTRSSNLANWRMIS
jgi:hypothetical protein